MLPTMAQVAGKQEEELLVERLTKELEKVTASLEPHFSRREAHEAATNYVKGLLSRAERKNSWGLSEETGKEDPYAFQHMLRRGSWDEGGVRDDVLSYSREKLGEKGVVPLDETGFVKKGDQSAGVARQYTGTAGRVENAQVGVFMAYVTPRGHTLIDRELYIPEHWFEDRERCRKAGIGDEVVFRTKPELARQMVERALKAGLEPSWVVGDEVYGRDERLRQFLEEQGLSYVLAVATNTYVERGVSRLPAAQWLKEVEPQEWKRLSAGNGSKGPRLYEWAVVKVNSYPAPQERWLMFRRSLTDATDVAHYLVHAPADTSLKQMVEAAGTRWPVEECFEQAKGEVGLDEYEVRTYTAWYRHMTLCMVALAFLAGARVVAHSQEEPLRPKVLALPHHRQGMRRFRSRRGLDSSGFRFKNSDA
ncbi:MAG TPA: IS701 family transposase [Hyalangium sp.]|nr:IS701 family transposase [Hyalangium sp.]